MLGPGEPVQASCAARSRSTGAGPNPLLQNHPLMAFHPPILYLGYVGFTIPFSFAIAALVTGRFGEGWLADTRRTTLVAWGFLTVGIILGAWWSYEVLGWGGYWAWDPVENASLLPWLTATAFIHSVMVQERRGMLRVWNLSLVIATFCLTILGTFLTRSGVINSVHAFTQSDIGPWLLDVPRRRRRRRARARSRGAATSCARRAASTRRCRARPRSSLNNLLFAGLRVRRALGTVFPLLAEALQGSQLSVGEPYFDRMGDADRARAAVPDGGRAGAAVARRERRGAAPPAARSRRGSARLTMVVAVIARRARRRRDRVAFGLGAFALAGIVAPVRARRPGAARRALGERVPVGARSHGARRTRGSTAGSSCTSASCSSRWRSAASSALRDASARCSLRQGRVGDGRGLHASPTSAATVDAARRRPRSPPTCGSSRATATLGVYTPAISTFPNSTEGIGTPSVHTGLRATTSTSRSSRRRTSGAGSRSACAVNPLVVWLWIGGGVMALGTHRSRSCRRSAADAPTASRPRRRTRRARRSPEPRRRRELEPGDAA